MITFYHIDVSESFVVLVISVTGVAVMQQLEQQTPLDKGEYNNTDSPCCHKLLSRGSGLSFFLRVPYICQLPDPKACKQIWWSTSAHSCYSAVSAALCTGEWCSSLCKCYTFLSSEPSVTVQRNVRADGTAGLLMSLLETKRLFTAEV